jgi:uncharacterized membrane protein
MTVFRSWTWLEISPPVLEIENHARKGDFELLKKKKNEIDRQAHKQVKRNLFLQTTLGLTFLFTFWEFSWDVIVPVAFFLTSSDLLVYYAYFLITLCKLSYRSYMERLFQTRRGSSTPNRVLIWRSTWKWRDTICVLWEVMH